MRAAAFAEDDVKFEIEESDGQVVARFSVEDFSDAITLPADEWNALKDDERTAIALERADANQKFIADMSKSSIPVENEDTIREEELSK